MAQELPAQKIFDYLAAMYNCITKYAQKQPPGVSDYQFTLFALVGKALAHDREAMYILARGSIGESIIILRAAYEATVVFLYLLNRYLANEEADFKKYLAYSQLVEHRNQLETLQLAGDKLDTEGKKEQQEKNDIKRDEIIAHGYHKLYGIAEEDVSNWSKLKKHTNKAHFIPFEEMRNYLDDKPETIGIAKVGFQIYNLGSQIAHSHYNMTLSLYAKDQSHPIYNEHDICRQIIFIMIHTSKGLQSLNALKSGFREEFGQLLGEALTEIRHASGDATPL